MWYPFAKKEIVASGSLSRMAWQRFRKDGLGMGSLVFIVFTAIIAMLGYLITPDPTPFANDQHLELANSKPGFSFTILKISKNENHEPVSWFSKMLFGKRNEYLGIPIDSIRFTGTDVIAYESSGITGEAGRESRHNLADVVFPLDPNGRVNQIQGDRLEFDDIKGNRQTATIPELQEEIRDQHIARKTFWLGSDRYGRDQLSMLIIGTRVSLTVGFIAVFISLVIGIALGALAGFFRGWIDDLIVWFINVIWSIPTLLLVIAITFALGRGFWQVFIAVGLTMWVEVARLVRGQIFSLREKEYVEAAKALGFNNIRIIWRHILPNVMSPVIVIAASNFASAILIEAGLSFLGIGVQPPMPSWGSMIRDNYGYIILDSAFLAVMPGLAIMLMVLAFMLLGNALRDALDVRTVPRGQ